MGTPYAAQLADKVARVRHQLDPVTSGATWLEPLPSRESGFRNKAKLVVGGSPRDVTLGILDQSGRGVDLRDCGLYEPAISQALPQLIDIVNRLELQPYSVPHRSGELKNILVTANPVGELMVRLVMRSTHHLARITSRREQIYAALPHLKVLSVNILPEHKAVLEGEREIILTEQSSLPMVVNGHTLRLPVASFFQTNTAVAAGLYRQAATWVDQAEPNSIWDLYCGIGGFAAHVAAPGREVTGVEVSAEAITAARTSSPQVSFVAGDATAYARRQPSPDLVIVNPPRRGLGRELSAWLELSAARTVVYSSCHPGSMAEDLRQMPSWRVVQARVFDMFPQTHHVEVMALLTRQD